MAFDGRYGEVGDFSVGDILLVLDVVDKSSKSGAENYCGFRQIGYF